MTDFEITIKRKRKGIRLFCELQNIEEFLQPKPCIKLMKAYIESLEEELK